MAMLRSNPSVRRIHRRLAVVRRTGRLHPNWIPLAATGRRIYVDRADARGAEIVRGLGRGHQPALIELWQGNRRVDRFATRAREATRPVPPGAYQLVVTLEEEAGLGVTSAADEAVRLLEAAI